MVQYVYKFKLNSNLFRGLISKCLVPKIVDTTVGVLIYIAELSRNVLLSLNCHNYNIDDNNNN